MCGGEEDENTQYRGQECRFSPEDVWRMRRMKRGHFPPEDLFRMTRMKRTNIL
jgi:hypothetical protein